MLGYDLPWNLHLMWRFSREIYHTIWKTRLLQAKLNMFFVIDI